MQAQNNPSNILFNSKCKDKGQKQYLSGCSSQHPGYSINKQSQNPTQRNNLLLEEVIKEQLTDDESDEFLTIQNCQQKLSRTIDSNTQLQIFLKNKTIYITVVQAQFTNMSENTNQSQNRRKNNINIYKGKVKNKEMDGYMKGLFYDVVSLFIHLKLTDQVQFNIVRNQKRIINLLFQNNPQRANAQQQQESTQYFLNFYMNQILPGDRLVKRLCCIKLNKITLQPRHIQQIKVNKWKKMQQKVDQLSSQLIQIQTKLNVSQGKNKNLKNQNEELKNKIRDLNKKINLLQGSNKFKTLNQKLKIPNKSSDYNQKKKLNRSDIYYEDEFQSCQQSIQKDHKLRTNNQKQSQKLKHNRSSFKIPIKSLIQNENIKQESEVYQQKPKKSQKNNNKRNNSCQLTFLSKNQKKNTEKQKKYSQQKKKENEIIQNQSEDEDSLQIHKKSEKKTPKGQQAIQKLNKLFKNLSERQNQLVGKPIPNIQINKSSPCSGPTFNLVKKYVTSSTQSPRRIQLSGDSYLKISKQVQLINVPCKCLIIHFQSILFLSLEVIKLVILEYVIDYLVDLDFRTKSVRTTTVILRQFSVIIPNTFSRYKFSLFQPRVNTFLSLVHPLAQSIKNNKYITDFLKILIIQHSHYLGAYSRQFQPMINLINKNLPQLQKVSVVYPSGRRSCSNKTHWTAYLRKGLTTCLLGNFKYT